MKKANKNSKNALTKSAIWINGNHSKVYYNKETGFFTFKIVFDGKTLFFKYHRNYFEVLKNFSDDKAAS